MKRTNFSILLTLFTSLSAMTCVAEESYSPYVDRSWHSEVYWGDTHVHTNLSLDAYAGGNRAYGPEQAYRFARGEAP